MLRETWRKSTYSYVNTDCVEVAQPSTGTVAVRDSKRRGPVLRFDGVGWNAFLVGIRAGGRATPKSRV